jgi:hypothetical protein
MTSRAVLLIALGLVCGPASGAPLPSEAGIRAAVARALRVGGTEDRRTIECEGRARLNGAEGGYSLVYDGRGRFRASIDGAIPETRGFDGTTCWIRDFSGATRALDLQDRAVNLAEAWVQTGYWIAREAPVTFTIAPEGASDAELVLALGLKDGSAAGRLTVDRTTWRPTAFRASIGGDVHTWSFSDYRSTESGLLPFRVLHEYGGVTDEVRIERAQRRRSAERAYRFTPAPPPSARFDRRLPPGVETRGTRAGLLLVHPRINGRDAGWFIFDSGAGISAIDPTAAKELGLEKVGDLAATGVGGTIITPIRRDRTLQLGPLTLRRTHYIELDLKQIAAALQEPVVGVIGYPVFISSVAVVDSAAPSVELHDPSRFRLEAGRWQPLLLSDNNPCTTARFEGGREGLFRVDTGSTNTVSFHAPAVRTLRLLEGRETQPASESGAGGASAARRGLLEWFEVGGHRFEKPRVTFSLATQGAFTDDLLTGNIGQQLLKQFRVAFWFGGKKIAFIDHGP